MSVIIVCDGKECVKTDSIVFHVSESAKNAIQKSNDISVQHLCKNCFLEINKKVPWLSVEGWMVVLKMPLIKRRPSCPETKAFDVLKEQVKYNAQQHMEKR